MAISRRELSYLVNSALAGLDDATFIMIAELALSRKVSMRGGRFVVHKPKSPVAPISGPTATDRSPQGLKGRSTS